MVNAASPSSTTLADWLRPKEYLGGFPTDLSEYVSKKRGGAGAKDAVEGIINVFEWMAHLGYHKEFAQQVSSELDPIKQTLAVPGFLTSMVEMREKWNILHKTDDSEAVTNFTESVALSALNLSESAMACNSWGIYPLKEGLKNAKIGFWSAAGLLDGISLFREFSNAENYRSEIEHIQSPELKNIVNHRMQLSYLNVLKATATLAMASISLISLLFASLAHGFLFSPVVFLSLCSAWLILTYVTHFYGKMIDRWQEELPIGKV